MTILPSIANARDLGGLVLPGGKSIKPGLLLRGGALFCASQEDLDTFKDKYHLAKVFDFRTSMEISKCPDKQVEGAQHFWFPAFDENSQTFRTQNLPHEAYQNLGEWLVANSHLPDPQRVARTLYTNMVNNDFTIVQFAGFLQNIIATPSGAVYWHCSQGKDRTGLGAAFLLAALGADRDVIMDDYCRSAEYYQEEFDQYASRVNTPEEKAVIQTFISVNPDYFIDALNLIDERYGSMDNFLSDGLLLGHEDMEVLRARYLE